MKDQMACLAALLAATGMERAASAWEFRCRFVERVGNVDTPLPGNQLSALDGGAHRIRIQFGVFDDADGPAPMGGYLGWNVGTIMVSGPAGNSNESRTPGRLAPFNFAPASQGANGVPAEDPFEMLTDVDNTLGTQSPLWHCDSNGEAPPPPEPGVRGRNTFVSTYEITVDPNPGALDYAVTFAGNLVAADRWLVVGTANPPDCGDPSDPADDAVGSITYAPFPLAPRAFECTLEVFATPAPGSAVLVMGAIWASCGKRRRALWRH
ncbi:MAG: hypothetical protein AB7G11_03375 [Phycisphaerales bacterium]